ncbi:MAG: hypothetical protein WB791_08075 [Waddliaceae bacterium]
MTYTLDVVERKNTFKMPGTMNLQKIVDLVVDYPATQTDQSV